MKKDKKEELQSRRQFFKKAAKGALPILGALALSKIPFIAKATQATACDHGSCAGYCYGGCISACTTNCTTNALKTGSKKSYDI